MAITPGTYNMTVQRRADHSIQLVFKDSSDAAINLTGYTVAAQVWDEKRKVKFADWNVTYTNRSTGTVDIALTDVQTASFIRDATLYYDVLLTNPNGLKEYYLEGNINVSEGYTA
jgi:NAD dependent epimerase/dehydratase family enzyme|tara:strand:- start:149 stop:493 length:345 start_codon:yes stop_codon:yes gene_type:complete